MMNESDYAPSTNAKVWGVGAVVVLMIAAAILRVKTSLGVEALTSIGFNENGDPIYDKVGRDAIWEIWWRSRDGFISVSPQWLLTGALIGLLAVFCLALLAAVWIALSPSTTTETTTE